MLSQRMARDVEVERLFLEAQLVAGRPLGNIAQAFRRPIFFCCGVTERSKQTSLPMTAIFLHLPSRRQGPRQGLVDLGAFARDLVKATGLDELLDCCPRYNFVV